DRDRRLPARQRSAGGPGPGALAADRRVPRPGRGPLRRPRRQPRRAGATAARHGERRMMQSRRLDPLLRRAQEREDAVARELAERQRAHALQESRLEELRRYLEEYASTQMTAVSPAQLANRRAFLDRLESAVEQQSRNVDLSRQRLE